MDNSRKQWVNVKQIWLAYYADHDSWMRLSMRWFVNNIVLFYRYFVSNYLILPHRWLKTRMFKVAKTIYRESGAKHLKIVTRTSDMINTWTTDEKKRKTLFANGHVALCKAIKQFHVFWTVKTCFHDDTWIPFRQRHSIECLLWNEDIIMLIHSLCVS